MPALAPSTLPALQAAAEGPALPASAASDAAEAPRRLRSLNNFWDGVRLAPQDEEDEPLFAARPLGAEFAPDAPLDGGGRAAPWLATGDPKIGAALDKAVALARRTKAGRKALDAAEKLLADKPLPVLVKDLGRNYGEYDYLEKNMRLHRALFAPGREADLAGTLVHELTHVVQHTQGVPTNALEMEIEAHLQDLDMMLELGAKPGKRTFARQALDTLKKGPKAFIELIQAAVPGTVFLGESSFEEIEEQLEQDLKTERRRAKKSPRAAQLAAVIEKDLALVRSAEGQASYQAFSRRVLALLKRRAAEAAR